jgi:hypothetical protein
MAKGPEVRISPNRSCTFIEANVRITQIPDLSNINELNRTNQPINFGSKDFAPSSIERPTMSVSPVSSASAITSVFANYAQKVTGAASPLSSSAPAQSSALQEASETPAQTLKEAHNGDQTAKIKLQQQQKQQTQAAPSETGKGEVVDHKA